MTLIRRIKVCDKIQLWNFLQYMSSLLSLTLQVYEVQNSFDNFFKFAHFYRENTWNLLLMVFSLS